MENQNDYQKLRNKLFTPQLSKIRILVDSKNIIHTTMDYTTNLLDQILLTYLQLSDQEDIQITVQSTFFSLNYYLPLN